MTTAQLQALKTDILTTKIDSVYQSKTFGIHLAESNFKTLADYYNSPTSPNQMIWKPDLKTVDLSKAIVMSAFVALTAVKQNGYFVLTQADTIDATDANIRAGFVTIFGAGTQTVTNLTALAQKVATNFEYLLTTSNVSSAYGVTVTPNDIIEAIRS